MPQINRTYSRGEIVLACYHVDGGQSGAVWKRAEIIGHSASGTFYKVIVAGVDGVQYYDDAGLSPYQRSAEGARCGSN